MWACSRHCVQCVCALYCFQLGVASRANAWTLGAGLGRSKRWVCPRCGVTFEPCQVALGAWHEVKFETMSVNAALYAGVIEGTVRPDGS